MKILRDFQEEIARCVKCGACRSACPTFNVLKMEPAAPRGKMALLEAWLQAEIGPSERLIKHIEECVLCAACEQVCPNDVPVTTIIMKAREEIYRSGKSSLLTSIIMKVLKNKTLMDGLTRAGFFVQKFLFTPDTEGEGCRRLVPLPYIQKDRLVPPLAKKSFMDGVKAGLYTLQGNTNGPRIGFFSGCLINYLLPHIGFQSLNILHRTGASVIVPLDQACCGMPALTTGRREDAKALALKNLEAFESMRVDYITTACATCTDCLKRKFPEMLGEESPEMEKRVLRFSEKVRDITDLLINELKIDTLLKTKNHPGRETPVTYHDPCHLRRGLGIKDEPRALIEMAGFSKKEMGRPCRCCGLGGSFNITHYGLSMAINRLKSEDIRQTGASIVATACPGCMIQLRDGLHKIDARVKVRHVIELLAERLQETP